MYASAVCSGKVTPGGKKKKAAGGYNSNGISQSRKKVSGQRKVNFGNGGSASIVAAGCGAVDPSKRKQTKLFT
jgi:hypothetical protein